MPSIDPFSPRRFVLTLIQSTLVWAAIASIGLLVGSTSGLGIPTREQFQFRLENVLLCSLIGAALGAAGVVFQAILRNPLADPYLLGVSAGATLFSQLWRILPAFVLSSIGSSALTGQSFAFLGAMLAMLAVMGLASRRGGLEPVTLLLVGVIVNALCASLFLLINALERDLPAGGGPLALLVGGINTSLTSQQRWTALILIGGGWGVLLLLAGQLNVARLSDAEAHSLGLHVQRLRWIGLIFASLMTAAAVSLSGPIGFVGLVCPHLARLIVGQDNRRLFPFATAMGAGTLTLADALSRYLAGAGRAETLLPVGVLTSLLGGPFFLVMLRRRGNM